VKAGGALLAVWTPPVQPIFHPNDKKSVVVDPDLEVGATPLRLVLLFADGR
jgi:hypothetical protein